MFKAFYYSLIMFFAVLVIQPVFAQNYYDSLALNLDKLNEKEKIETICNIPFDKMNSNTTLAIKYYKQAKQIAEEKYPDYLANIYENLSTAYYYSGDYDLAVQNSLKAIKSYEKLRNNVKVGTIYANLGYQMKRRDLNKAFDYMRIGLDILLKTGDKKIINPAINNFGVLHEMNGNIDSALFYYNKSLNIVEALNDSIGLPYSLNNIAGAYVIMGAFEKVLPYYNRAYKIRKKRKDLNGLAENEAYFGDFYFKQKKYLDAIPFYIKSLNLCKQMDYTYLQKVNAEQLASCYASISKFDSALVYLKQAVALNNKLMDESTVQTINNLEIQFETEKKEKQIAEQDAKIAQQELDIKQGTYLLISIAGVGFIMLVISFFIIKQIRLKQKQLLEENKLKDEITKFKILTKLNDERLRIAKDLHDNIGAQLTFIISFLDNMLYVLDENNQQFKAKLTELNEFSKKAIKELRLTINQLNKN